MKFHPLTVKEVERLTPDAVSIVFDVPPELEDDYRYVQGQHITVRRTINGEDLRRCYSVCSSVADRELRVAVKAIRDGRFSGWINSELKPGMEIEVFPPIGEFYTPLDPQAERRYAGFAGGSGITPILSLIKTTLETEPKSRFTLIYGNRDVNSVIFLERLAGLKDRYLDRLELFHVLENGDEDLPLFNGLLTEEKCKALLTTVIDPADVDEFFICGPGPMMDSAEAALRAKGVAPEHIHIERFLSGDAARQTTRPEARRHTVNDPIADIAVIIDGSRTEFQFDRKAESVLDAARDAGANAPFACKGGVCATCRAKVLEGRVEMAKCYGLEEDEVAAGYVLTCQSRPTTDKVVLSYDQ